MRTAEFEMSLRDDGYQEIETKGYPAGTVNDQHHHPFDVRALVLEGDITLTVSGQARTYRAGEVFTMAAGCEHIENIGASGVRYLVGRRRQS